METCVDIDECKGPHICDEYADCHNEEGGYQCHCIDGFEGNGYECFNQSSTHSYIEASTEIPVRQRSCGNSCADNAFCNNDGMCICRPGYNGNGFECQPICGPDTMWNGAECIRTASNEECE